MCWVIALGVLPSALFTYSIVMSRSAIVLEADIEKAASLRYRSLWLYGAARETKAEEWRPELAQMETLRTDLAKRYPQAVAKTDSEWNIFSHSLITNGRVDWTTANQMRESANTLTETVVHTAKQNHILSERLFYFALAAMTFSMGTGAWLVRLRSCQEKAQHAVEERFRVLFDQSSDAHLLFDETGIIDCNNAAIQMLRCQDKAEVLALHPAVLSPELQPDGRLSMEKCIEMDATAHKNGYHRFEWLHKKTDGEVFPVEVTLTPVELAGRETLLVVWHDLTERKKAEDALQITQHRLEEAQKVAHLGSWEYNLITGTINWSDQLFHIMGLDPAQGEPDYATNLAYYHPDDALLLDTCVQRAISEGIEYELDMRRAVSDGVPLCWYHAIGKPICDHQGKVIGLVGTLQDITEQKMAQRQIEAANEWLAEANQALEEANVKFKTLATTDGLTGIANHRAFQEALAEDWQRCYRYKHSFSVILMDVDKFKLFNDTFGHPEGDTVLKTVAQLLKNTAREIDFVARYGGEEFIILLLDTDSQGACKAAERFRCVIEQHDWTLHPVTASFGVATLMPLTKSAQELIDCADKALYVSKKDGRNRVTHFAALEESPMLPSIAA